MTLREQGFEEYDEVIVTGYITSEGRHYVKDLEAVISTLSNDGAIKVWPHNEYDPQLPKNHNGKLWFTKESLINIKRT